MGDFSNRNPLDNWSDWWYSWVANRERDMSEQQIVFDNLNSAMDNGYDVCNWPWQDIAADLMAFAADCGDMTEAQLKPHIEAWLKQQA